MPATTPEACDVVLAEYIGAGDLDAMLALSALLAVPAEAAEQSPEAIVRSVDEAFVRHLEAGDVKGILSLYADDADVIWPGEKDEAYDKKALEPMARDFVAAMKNGKLVQKKV